MHKHTNFVGATITAQLDPAAPDPGGVPLRLTFTVQALHPGTTCDLCGGPAVYMVPVEDELGPGGCDPYWCQPCAWAQYENGGPLLNGDVPDRWVLAYDMPAPTTPRVAAGPVPHP